MLFPIIYYTEKEIEDINSERKRTFEHFMKEVHEWPYKLDVVYTDPFMWLFTSELGYGYFFYPNTGSYCSLDTAFSGRVYRLKDFVEVMEDIDKQLVAEWPSTDDMDLAHVKTRYRG